MNENNIRTILKDISKDYVPDKFFKNKLLNIILIFLELSAEENENKIENNTDNIHI